MQPLLQCVHNACLFYDMTFVDVVYFLKILINNVLAGHLLNTTDCHVHIVLLSVVSYSCRGIIIIIIIIIILFIIIVVIFSHTTVKLFILKVCFCCWVS